MPMSFTNQLQHIKDTYDQMEQAQTVEIGELKLKLDAAVEKERVLSVSLENVRDEMKEKNHIIEVRNDMYTYMYLPLIHVLCLP